MVLHLNKVNSFDTEALFFGFTFVYIERLVSSKIYDIHDSLVVDSHILLSSLMVFYFPQLLCQGTLLTLGS